MTNSDLNQCGLAMSIIGGLVVWAWGWPQPDMSEGTTLSVGENTVFADGTSEKELRAAARRLKRKHQILSSIGMGLLIGGFALQLFATY